MVSEDFHEDRLGEGLDSLSEKARKNRRFQHQKAIKAPNPERTDALTCEPLDYHQEEATRKFETNKWLQHHFGSESSRSQGSSIHDLNEEEKTDHTTSGGNIITITMSPRPATPEDTVDASPPGRLRRWGGNAPLTSTPKAPPMPPPIKTNLFGSSTTKVSADDGLDSRMVTARARLRPTGKNLNESLDSNGNDSNSSTRLSNSGRYGGLPERIQVLPVGPSNTFTPPMSPSSPISPISLNSPVNSLRKNDPVYGSRFRSGTPVGMEDPESPPPPLPNSEPPSFVSRSQSFNVSSRPWQQNGTSTTHFNSLYSNKSSNLKKSYKSTDRLDSNEYSTPNRQMRVWPPPKREPSPEPIRDPPQHQRFSRKTSPAKYRAPSPPHFVAREATTQTEPTPVPPPRTKRKNKNKPRNTYFFGENDSALTSTSSSLYSSTLPNISSRHKHKETNTVESTTRYSRVNNNEPKIERRFKTTKTITPVVVLDANELISKNKTEEQEKEEKRKARHYRSMDQLNDAPRSTWTSTINPKRRPKTMYVEDNSRPTTLPRKSVHDYDPPNKRYFFGQGEPTNKLRNRLNGHSGSMINVSNNRSEKIETENHNSMNNYERTTLSSLRNNSNKSVNRSHSFNIQPANNIKNSSHNKTFTESFEEKKSSSVYHSSPYLNLRSPNLIASIARTNSIKKLNDSSANSDKENSPSYNGTRNSNSFDDENDDEKRKVFMKGLLTNAPELYHYLHGEENNNSSSEPPRLIRPPELSNDQSAPSTPRHTSTPKYFTFGRDSTSNSRSNSRSNSISNKGNNNSYFNSIDRNRKNIENDSKFSSPSSPTSPTNNYLNTRRSSNFNLKTKGSSLLYSPSFRSNTEKAPPPWERRDSGEKNSENETWSSKHRVSSSLQRNDGPVLIQVRDWNTR